jgi:hypothetical protein
MTLHDKIISIYSELDVDDIRQDPFLNGVIILQNDSDGNGDYIKSWNHPTLTQPTQSQLDAAE